MEIPSHPYFVGVQYHPEYISRPMRPSPPYLGLILAATGKLQTFLTKGSASSSSVPRLRQTSSSDLESSDDEDITNLVRTLEISKQKPLTPIPSVADVKNMQNDGKEENLQNGNK